MHQPTVSYILNICTWSGIRLRMTGFHAYFKRIGSDFILPSNSVKAYRAIIILFVALFSLESFSQIGIHGPGNITGSAVDVNTRTYLSLNAASGSNSIRVNNSALNGAGFSGNLASGDLILIIQMQGASINTTNTSAFGTVTNYNSAGLYEFRCVSSVPNATTINVSVPLTNNYSAAGKVQVIRIPRYTTFNLAAGNSITPAAWNGNVGGISVIEVGSNATINGTFNATGTGFRGGAFDNQTQAATVITTSYFSNSDLDGGNKGESIAGSESDYNTQGYRFGRGAIANGGGGGNSHNAGGGGGSNGGVTTSWNGLGNPNNSGTSYSTAWNLEGGTFSANTSSGGGRGGYTYGSNNENAITTAPGNTLWGGNGRQNVGGYGGRPMDYSTARLFFGGGGGAGDGNNNAASGGANGGGMVIVLCYGNMTGSGSFISNGATAANTSSGHNDAPGGGGGGGTVILSATGTISNAYTINANGGNGGNQLITNAESEGPGGGGGGGYIAISSGTPTRVVNGGSNGTTSSSSLTEFLPNGATSGGAGTITTFSPPSVIGSISAHAGPDANFCKSTNMNASLSANATGSWSVIAGTGGTFANVNNPLTLFSGDSVQIYTLVWSVTNNLCQQAKDTVRLFPVCLALPVHLVDFTAKVVDGDVLLDWMTSMEENLRYFVVEKSYDQLDWQELTTIYTSGNSYTLRSYQAVDERAAGNLVFYRIRQVYTDLTVDYSTVVTVEMSAGKAEYTMFPVPVKSKLTVQGRREHENLQIMVYNHVGQVMEISTETVNENTVLDLGHLHKGLYFVKVFRNDKMLYAQAITKD
jgi:hypothetical protein